PCAARHKTIRGQKKASLSTDSEAFFLLFFLKKLKIKFMVDLDQEYKLFRKICSQNYIKANKVNDLTIQRFIEKGLQIKLKNDRYSLTKRVSALSSDKIRSGLNSDINRLIDQLDVIYETDSTNKTITGNKTSYSVLLSESQTDGSGRKEKKWVSPLGENIYLSIKFHLTDSTNIHFIPLLTAVSICKTLIKIGIDGCQIKWPNDLYLDEKKLGGILVESRYNIENGHAITVGIGLNVNMELNHEIDQSWTSLYNETKKTIDRNALVSHILSDLIKKFNCMSEFDFQEFMLDWSPLDYLKGSIINIVEENCTYTATSLGISQDGALLAELFQNNNESEKKVIKTIYSADVSVKALMRDQIKD
ncbi:MAG: biotin--[acetyl-CoA-carboxylase] ligase, partial [gamma proteobacterium symbiont of Lucinoma myriamae]|nr:biotin--[acetyl-CoA-carboxylase] ligase [gamma proteobacterium symbiont of Lucinoma myriamae]MCU7819982.1 biotin--[acetyl-CoA-carboxylase] ligase [gamma proteobacterium symbiont of Lucinoma myriamae]